MTLNNFITKHYNRIIADMNFNYFTPNNLFIRTWVISNPDWQHLLDLERVDVSELQCPDTTTLGMIPLP